MPDLQSDPSNADEFAQDGTGLRDMGRISLDILSPTPLNLDGLASDTSGAQASGGYSFKPITDLTLDRYYADLAQQHDPDATPGVLGTFQQLPRDGTPSHPGPIGYSLVPEVWPVGSANSNSAASAVANRAISLNPSPLNQGYLEPYPGSLSPGWYKPIPGWKP